MHNFLFGIFPYIALGVGIMGTIARYERDPFTWKTSSSQLLRRRQLVIGSILFHVGVMALIGGAMLMHRRLTDPRIRQTSSFWDIAILTMLLAQLLLGLGTIFASIQHLDGEEMVKFMSWAQGIFTFEAGAAAYIEGVAPVFKLHLFLGLLIILVFPFTRLVHVVSGFATPFRYLLARPGYQIVRSRRRAPLKRRNVEPAE